MALITVKPKKECTESKRVYYGLVRRFLLICRYFGLLPISGLSDDKSELSRVTFKSWYSIIYIFTIVTQGIVIHFIIYELFSFLQPVLAFVKSAEILLTISNFCTNCLVLRFSVKWQALLEQIKSIEIQLPTNDCQRTFLFIQCLCIIILILSAVERCIGYLNIWNLIESCVSSTNEGHFDLGTFFFYIFGWIFSHVSFHYVIAILLTIVKIQAEFLWNFVDVFIILNSVYLSSMFKHFNQLINYKHHSVTRRGVPSWCNLQVHYTRISRLVTIIDEAISPLILVSYLRNLLFIFKQIFIFTKYKPQNMIYLAFSCSYIILKTALVSYFATNIHVESRRPLDALHNFPSSAYDTNMRRLMIQVYYSNICLTGYKLFSVTRTMILTMVATLVTYELVLFQF